MVLMAYLAGLISTPAAFLGAFMGRAWYQRYRRAQAVSEPVFVGEATVPSQPSSPQDGPLINRATRRNAPASRKRARGHR